MTEERVLDVRQSAVINAMRFILIVLVLFVHMLPPEFQAVAPEFSAKNAYVFFTEMISHNLGAMAVPAFFVFSGYFFFLPLKGALTASWLSSRWKKRVSTLLIPYLFWNLFMILAICVKNGVFSMLGMEIGDEFETVRKLEVMDWLWTGPADFPLWYLRDLICMTALAPAFYLLCKLLKNWTPLVLIAFYLSGFVVPVTGLGSTAITFFGLGTFLGISSVNIVEMCEKVKWPSIIAASVLLVVTTFFNVNPAYGILERVFIPVAVVACVNVTASLSDKVIGRFSSVSAAVFFIYAAHEIYILGWTNGLFYRLFGHSVASYSLRYVVCPFFVLAVCLALFWIMNKWIPRTLAFACGGRAKKK